MEEEWMLSTIDNPHHPFKDYPAWSAFDEAAGYATAGLLDRIAFTSYELSELDERYELNRAIERILMEDEQGLYIKVRRNDTIRAVD